MAYTVELALSFGLGAALSHFSTLYTALRMLFLSFRASLSPLASSRPICLFHRSVIHYSCCLGLMVLLSACQFFAALVFGLFFFLPGSHKWPSTLLISNKHQQRSIFGELKPQGGQLSPLAPWIRQWFPIHVFASLV